MAKITLSDGQAAIVDDADLALVAPWKWHVQSSGRHQYARRNTTSQRRTHSIYMHRVIMGEPLGLVVDHIDGDGLNNQRSNLRICTQAQNTWNRRDAHRYAGVIWRPATQRWRAIINHGGRRFEIGAAYSDKETAADARLFVSTILRGDFTKLHQSELDRLLIGPTMRRYLFSLASKIAVE